MGLRLRGMLWKEAGAKGILRAARSRVAILMAAGLVLALSVSGGLPHTQAETQSPYQVSEFSAHLAQGTQSRPVISGKWLLWTDEEGTKRAPGRNLETGLDFGIATDGLAKGAADVSGDMAVTLERDPDQGLAIFGYRLPDGQRFTIAPYKTGEKFTRGEPRTDGKMVVWSEGSTDDTNIYAYDLTAQRLVTVSTNSSLQASPVVSGTLVLWLDSRNAPYNQSFKDIYGYDLSTNQEFRVTTSPRYLSAPSISGSWVVWSTQGDDGSFVKGYNLASKQEIEIAQANTAAAFSAATMDGDLVVWSGRGEFDQDVFGYDLKQSKQFIISRAIGNQGEPQVSGKTVVWTDARHSGAGKYEYNSDIYGAKLESAQASVPPIVGAPAAADAKIQIVWPHGSRPVAEADKANVGAWLFFSDTLKLAPCQWSPKVKLWKAVNDEPAKPVATGLKEGGHFYASNRAVPTWDFNDVDVSAARDSKNRIFFFTTIEGLASRTNVWAHAGDARTYFPQQDVPTGVAAISGTVDAKIQIVWPKDNAPVDQAKQVNISASLFSPGTRASVQTGWNPVVRLYRSLNNEVGRQVAVGQKRIAQSGSLSYPVWDFNNVDVSAANDPVNKYYFTLTVDGVTTNSNVWSHGADARTYFPQIDTPAQSCGGS